MGTGLPLVKSILNGISSQISIDSKVNNGTMVIITFIREMVKESEKRKIIDQIELEIPDVQRNFQLQPDTYDREKKTVLVVEDDIRLLYFMQNIMVKDFNFFYARDGQEALRKLKVIPKPDTIVSDILMEIMSGYEFFIQLKKKEEMQDIPFIFLSAKTDIAEKLKGLKHGAVDYIDKPFDIEILIAKIKALIRDHEIYKQKAEEYTVDRITRFLKTRENTHINYSLLYSMYQLTNREREVIHHILNCMNNREIAEALFVSLDTVYKHVQNIKEKCKINDKLKLFKLFCY